jgi:hypothetical protein
MQKTSPASMLAAKPGSLKMANGFLLAQALPSQKSLLVPSDLPLLLPLPENVTGSLK